MYASIKDIGAEAGKLNSYPKIPFVKSLGWSWDVEILVKAQWAGFKVLEVPARVKEVYDRGSSFNVFGGTWSMGINLFKILFGKRDFLRRWKKLSV